MRSTSFTIRSASSQISRVKVRSSSPADCSRSWAAPRMPESGFLISCASIAASADDRARRAAMGELAVHLVGDGALLEHHHHMVRLLGKRRYVKIDQPVAGIARRRQIDLVFVDGGAAAAHLLDQRQQRAAERHQFAQLVPPQHGDRGFEEGLGRHIGVGDAAIGCDRDHRQRQRVQHRLGRAAMTHRRAGHAIHSLMSALRRRRRRRLRQGARGRRSDRRSSARWCGSAAACRSRRPRSRLRRRAPSPGACARA